MHQATAAADKTAERAANAGKKTDRRTELTLLRVYSRSPAETMTLNIVEKPPKQHLKISFKSAHSPATKKHAL